MSGNVPPQPMTYKEYLRTPEGGIYNLVGGLLLHEPSPGERHQRVLLRLARLLAEHVEAREAGRVYAAPLDVHLEPTEVYEPDIFFVSTERLPYLGERGLVGVAPDLAVEILSPYSARFDRHEKRQAYERHGCLEYWLVDPSLETLEPFMRDADGILRPLGVFGRSSVLRSSVLPELALAVDRLFC